MKYLLLPVADLTLLGVARISTSSPISGPGLLGVLILPQLVVWLGGLTVLRLRRSRRTSIAIGVVLCAAALSIGTVMFDVDTGLGSIRLIFGCFLILMLVAAVELAVLAATSRDS